MTTPAGQQADRTGTTASSNGQGRPGRRHVAIIGGGITGLSAAWYLEKLSAARNAGLTYTLLEAGDRWGGKLRTERIDGFGEEPFVVEAGPDSFISDKPSALRLARELGLEDRVIDTNDDKRKTFVVVKGRPVPLPDGVLMIVPTKIMPFALSPLISLPGKLRMGLDLFIPARRDGQDETLAEFIERRLGHEALDKLAEPLMSGIYNAEADRQSLLATFPRFRALEEEHGSLTRGMLASRRARSPQAAPGNGRKHGMFISMRLGTEELPEALVEQLGGDLRLNCAVQRLERLDGGGYLLTLPDGERLQAEAVIIATPAYVTADLLRGVAPEAAAELAQIRYVSTGTLSLGYRRDEIDHPLNGFGIVIPRSERRRINAVTWSSTKFDHRAPAGYALLRVFFGGSRSPEMMDRGDAEVLAVARSELRDLMGIDAEPVFHRITRWHRSNPQYDVGHLERVDAIEAALPPGLCVTGAAYRGIGVPDCIKQAEQSARQVVEALVEGVADR